MNFFLILWTFLKIDDSFKFNELFLYLVNFLSKSITIFQTHVFFNFLCFLQIHELFLNLWIVFSNSWTVFSKLCTSSPKCFTATVPWDATVPLLCLSSLQYLVTRQSGSNERASDAERQQAGPTDKRVGARELPWRLKRWLGTPS